MNDRGIPQWLLSLGIGVFLLLLVGLWYRYLGPGSVPPPPTRVEAPDIGGVSPKARAMMQQGH
jgi:ABC-type transporter Mla subunit MlaD